MGQRPLLATAEHVIRDYDGPLGITPFPHIRLYTANIVARHVDTDLALLEVADYSPPRALQLADDSEIVNNQLVTCFEYGTTRRLGKKTELAPATRIGNVTRSLRHLEVFGKAGDDCLELSFPALRGASGAPIISNMSGNLWGIVIVNYDYHLLPAPIESVLDEDNQIYEEIKFMLPQAIAVHVKHLRELLSRITE